MQTQQQPFAEWSEWLGLKDEWEQEGVNYPDLQTHMKMSPRPLRAFTPTLAINTMVFLWVTLRREAEAGALRQ